MVLPSPSLGLPVSDGFPPHIDPKLLPHKFQNLVAISDGGRLPVKKATGDKLDITVTFEYQGLPGFFKVGVGLKIENKALWVSKTIPVLPAVNWTKETVKLTGEFDAGPLGASRKIDVLKAIQVPFRDLNIDGEKMLLADWDRDVYEVATITLPKAIGLPRLSIFGEGAKITAIGLPTLSIFGEGAKPVDVITASGLPTLAIFGE